MKSKAKVGSVIRITKAVRAKHAMKARSAKKIAKVVKPKEKSALEVERLILDHRENGRKLARSLLRRWRVRMPAEETDSIVDLTLCEAARRYSDKHGASFMTFFFYHLRGNLVRAVATAAKSNNFVVAFARTAGIDVGDWGSGNGEQGYWNAAPEFTHAENHESDLPEQILLRRERITVCQQACSQLDSLEREVLTRLYANEEPLVDIARALGYSRCHISRVKKRALERLRELMRDFNGGEGGRPGETTIVEADEEISNPLVDQIQKLRKRRSRRRPIALRAMMVGELRQVAAG